MKGAAYMSSELVYRGTIKHKMWRPDGAFGTICPKWTHEQNGRDFGGDPYRHPWEQTQANEILANSFLVGDRRYGAAKGIAFCAHETGDGTWHGYPVPWCMVPSDAVAWLIDTGLAKRRDIKRQKLSPQPGIYWALTSDD